MDLEVYVADAESILTFSRGKVPDAPGTPALAVPIM